MTSTQSALQEHLDSARAQTDDLFDLLEPDALYSRPIQERHRLIFYLGHLEAFDWNQVGRYALRMPSFHPEFDKLFELGIDPEPGRAPHDTPADWPTLSEVRGYQAEARRRIDQALPDAPQQFAHLIIEHRWMHAETFAYLLHNLNGEGFRPGHAKDPVVSSGRVSPNPMISIPAGVATLGQDPHQFGWDNEFQRHSVDVDAFKISKYKITNGEYLRFMETGAKAPHFWSRQNGEWFYRGMFGLIPLPLDWPVYVTQDEASAYAAWIGKSLLTEPQFHRAAYGTQAGTEQPYPWGESAPNATHGNFDFDRWDPVSVTANPQGASAFGVEQLVGNGWEWTRSPFAPFQGFQPFPFYPTYSANFFDNAHFVIKGGSSRTASCFLRRSFRNWFRPNYPYVYAGFRLVED